MAALSAVVRLANIENLNAAQIGHGPFAIGLFFNTILLGVMMTQAYIYFTTGRKDHWGIRLFVVVLVTLDIVNSITLFYFSYNALVNHFGDDDYALRLDWSFALDPLLVGLIATMCQTFFAWRVQLLTKSTVATIIILTLAMANLASSTTTAVFCTKVQYFSQLQSFAPAVIVWLASSAAADLVICLWLSKYLRDHKQGFAYSDKLIDKIIITTMQTGMVTTVVALLDLGFYLGNPTGLHLLFNVPLAKLYSSSLISSLNARGGWKYGSSRGQTSDKFGGTGDNVQMHNRTGGGAPYGGRSRVGATSTGQATEIYVDVEQFKHTEHSSSHDLTEIARTKDMRTGAGSAYSDEMGLDSKRLSVV